MIIQSRNVYFEEKLQPLQVEIRNDKIAGVFPYGFFKADKDYGENWILPGLCDIHSHGYHGTDACLLGSIDNFVHSIYILAVDDSINGEV